LTKLFHEKARNPYYPAFHKKNEKDGQVDTGSFLKVVRWTGGRESH
jgi:hypothetical protein